MDTKADHVYLADLCEQTHIKTEIYQKTLAFLKRKTETEETEEKVKLNFYDVDYERINTHFQIKERKAFSLCEIQIILKQKANV